MREGFLKEVILSSGPGGEEEHCSGGLTVRKDSGLGGRMDWMICCSSRIQVSKTLPECVMELRRCMDPLK